MGLSKFSSNFTDLAISLFSGYVRLAASIFGKPKEVSKYQFVCFILIDDV